MTAQPNTALEDTPADTPAHADVPVDSGVESGPANAPPLETSQAVGAATDLKQVVAQENSTIASIIETLDSYAIEIGDTHISIWSALVVLLVIIGVWFFARFGSKLAHKILGKLTALDSTQ
ncbi:MAG TPA: hypothetical protein VLA37_10650, partial [Sphingomonadaceae bacterium]|nr:hypothetical protein [Sphingomonadaceae bacterium]